MLFLIGFILTLLIIGGFITLWIYIWGCYENDIKMFEPVTTKEKVRELEDRIEKLEKEKRNNEKIK